MKERLHFVESMRATLMVLVVVYHVAAIYKPSQNWLIYSESPSILIGLIASFTDMFIMPGFFLISGYLASESLKGKSPRSFLTTRLVRIGIPLIVTALTFNSLQGVLLYTTGWKDFTFKEYWLNGEYISHLWFLVNLLCYFVFMAMFAMLVNLNSTLRYKLQKLLGVVVSNVPPLVVIPCLAFVSWSISISYRFGFPLFENYGGVIYMPLFMSFIPYFFFGALISVVASIEKYASINSLLLLSFMAIGGLPLNSIAEQLPYGHIILDYQKFFLKWTSVFVCMGLFYRYANKPTELFRQISAASYSVYLSHHLLVVAIGLLFLKLDLNVFFNFAATLILVAVSSYAFHKFIVEKYKLAKLMFNGVVS